MTMREMALRAYRPNLDPGARATTKASDRRCLACGRWRPVNDTKTTGVCGRWECRTPSTHGCDAWEPREA